MFWNGKTRTAVLSLFVCLALLSTAAATTETQTSSEDTDFDPSERRTQVLAESWKPRTGVPEFVWVDRYAREISGYGEAVFHTILENTDSVTGTFTVDIGNDIIPDGLGPYDWIGFYCDTSGACHFGPWDYTLAPGEAETLDVHLIDNVGAVTGMALTTVSAASDTDTARVSFASFVGLPSILLVDDDDGASHETHLATAVEDADYAARPWDTSALGRPPLAQLSSYWAVLWTTADGSASLIDSVEEQKMMDYLDGGGNLMLASMDYLSSRGATNPFIADYLHISSWTSDSGGSTASGVGSDQISDGMSLSLSGGPFSPDNSDSFVPASPAGTVFTSPAGATGLKVAEGDHKAVFLSFPFEDVSTSAPAPDNQAALVGRIIDWFDLRSRVVRDAVDRRLVLEQNVPNPFNPQTEIAFTVPANAGVVALTIHNVCGQRVRTLVQDELPAGPALAVWDGRDDTGRQLASGIYLARLSAAGETALRKMTLLK